jgi:adenylosuccinate synthase
MIEYADVIVDLQAGDTGKGKVANYLTGTGVYSHVMRYNGGANAGHTVYVNGTKIVTHQVPVGIFHNIPSIIGVGCVVDIDKLIDELRMLKDHGFTAPVYIDQRCHVTTEAHRKEDATDTTIGTTKQGIGPTYRDKYSRKGLRIGELKLDYEFFKVIDTYQYFRDVPSRILCEGAQGFQIDIDWGDYPYVTSSHCTVGSACLNGIPPHKIDKIYGVIKAYETYSGYKTHYTNEDNPIFQKIQEIGGEFGATTGRKRKVRWLDLDGVIMAANINGVTDLIINKVDVLEHVDAFRYVHKELLQEALRIAEFKEKIEKALKAETDIESITWSTSPETV